MFYYRLLLIVTFLLVSPAFAQTLVRYQYDAKKYNSFTNKGAEETYRTFSNTKNSNTTYEITVNLKDCYNWSLSVTILKAAGLGTSTTGCSDRTYLAKIIVPPYKTAKTFKREMTRYDYYKVVKLAIYSDGSSKEFDQTYGNKKDTWSDMWTNVY